MTSEQSYSLLRNVEKAVAIRPHAFTFRDITIIRTRFQLGQKPLSVEKVARRLNATPSRIQHLIKKTLLKAEQILSDEREAEERLGFDPDQLGKKSAAYWAGVLVLALQSGKTERADEARRALLGLGIVADIRLL